MIINKKILPFDDRRNFEFAAHYLNGTVEPCEDDPTTLLIFQDSSVVTPKIIEAVFYTKTNKGYIMVETTSIPRRNPPPIHNDHPPKIGV